jgi:hypothetical protein
MRMVLNTSTIGGGVYFLLWVRLSLDPNLLLLKVPRRQLVCKESCEIVRTCCLRCAGCCAPCNCSGLKKDKIGVVKI